MGESLARRGRPTGMLRLFLRAPIHLYRWHLGWLLGQRFLMLQHVGRKTGLPRYTVIEVVDREPTTGRYFVCSGWGRGSDWFRNILHDPEVRVSVGTRTFAARAREMRADEAATRLTHYGERNPRALHKLADLMLGEAPSDLDAAVDQLSRAVPMVELTPRSAS